MHATCALSVLLACISHLNPHPCIGPSLALSLSAAVGVYGSQSATPYCINLQNAQLNSDMAENTNGYELVMPLNHQYCR